VLLILIDGLVELLKVWEKSKGDRRVESKVGVGKWLLSRSEAPEISSEQ
jgi:hypothetical protein